MPLLSLYTKHISEIFPRVRIESIKGRFSLLTVFLRFRSIFDVHLYCILSKIQSDRHLCNLHHYKFCKPLHSFSWILPYHQFKYLYCVISRLQAQTISLNGVNFEDFFRFYWRCCLYAVFGLVHQANVAFLKILNIPFLHLLVLPFFLN
jgi:hypothetical protein